MDQRPFLTEKSIAFTLPTNYEAEFGVMVALLAKPKLYGQLPALEADHFADVNMRLLWIEISALLAAGVKVTLAELLRRMAPDPHQHRQMRESLSEMVTEGKRIDIAAAIAYAEIVRDMAERRRLLDVCVDMAARVVDPHAYESAAEAAHVAIAAFSETAETRTEMEDAGEVGKRILNKLGRGPAPRWSTGIRPLDSAMKGGLYGGKVYVFQARKKTGKTSMLSTISYNLALPEQPQLEPCPHLFLSLEGNSEQSMEAMMARYARYNAGVFKDPPSDDMDFFGNMTRASEALAGRGLMFRHRPRMTLDQLKAVAARVALEGKLKGIILDYHQLVGGKDPKQSVVEHLDNVAQTIADSAANTGLWWIVAAQLNRGGEARGGDGILMACDQAYAMGRTYVEGPEDLPPAADYLWLEMTDTRYTPYMHIGNEQNPRLAVRKDIGPYIEER